MKKVLLLCFLNLGLLGAGASHGEGKFIPLHRLPPHPIEETFAVPSPDYYRLLTHTAREVRGVLQTGGMPAAHRPFPTNYMSYLMTGLDGTVSVNGHPHVVDFGTDPALRERARRLNGRRVFLQGYTETRILPLLSSMEGTPGDGTFQAVHYLVVTSVEEVEEYVRETVEVDVQGRYDHDHLLGMDGTSGPVVHVQGKAFVLDMKVSHPSSRAPWDGRVVRIKGTLGGWKTYVGPMIPGSKGRKYRVLNVTEIRPVSESWIKHGEEIEIGGPVQLFRHIKFGRGAVAISVAGRPHYLDFGGNDRLYALAGKAAGSGQVVRVTGNLRATDGAIEVVGLEVVGELEHYRENVTVEVRGFLQEVMGLEELEIAGRRFFQVNMNGRVLSLAFKGNPALLRATGEMVGATVRVRGRMVGDTIQVATIEVVVPADLRPWEMIKC